MRQLNATYETPANCHAGHIACQVWVAVAQRRLLARTSVLSWPRKSGQVMFYEATRTMEGIMVRAPKSQDRFSLSVSGRSAGWASIPSGPRLGPLWVRASTPSGSPAVRMWANCSAVGACHLFALSGLVRRRLSPSSAISGRPTEPIGGGFPHLRARELSVRIASTHAHQLLVVHQHPTWALTQRPARQARGHLPGFR